MMLLLWFLARRGACVFDCIELSRKGRWGRLPMTAPRALLDERQLHPHRLAAGDEEPASGREVGTRYPRQRGLEDRVALHRLRLQQEARACGLDLLQQRPR